ncbi:efflux RND transporter periplasmic adaptor subunit [Stutzerimonas tarimensis]|uniref:Efflux RND transporter periplasmic adaptor subunit n=1 Tax=Stutzerimonas tarimensis TaxID=1507735 RepID=A0ABV7T5M6_9GAMM
MVFLAGCGQNDEPAPPPPRVALVEPLQPASAETRVWRYPGVVESASRTQLSFEVGGRVERMLVDQGQRVERGQPLARLDSTDYDLQLREARSQLNQLEADLARRRALLAEGILAPAAIEALEAQVESAQVARDNAQRSVGRTLLAAPFDGVVARRLVETDMVVASGTPIFEMQAGGEEIEVGLDLPETAALELPLDSSLRAEGRMVVGEATMPLRYREHSTQPREGARTYRLTLAGEPPEGLNLLPGMAVRVNLSGPPGETSTAELFRIPLSALQVATNGGHFIWIVEGELPRRQPLQVERVVDDQALVRGELEPGSLIVVAGGSKLDEGQAVRTTERQRD